MSDISAYRFSDDRSLRFIPTDALVITVTLQPQERSQAQGDMVAPRPPRANLRSLNEAELLEAAVVVLYRPRVAGPTDTLPVVHLDTVGGPPLNVPVRGDYLEDADQPEAFEPDDAPRLADLDLAHRAQARPVGVHAAVRFQARQPGPAERANQLQVFEAGVPAIEGHARRLEPAPVRLPDHPLKVIVLRQGVLLLVEDAVIDRHMPVAVCPQQRNQVDAAHHRVVLARPVARHQLDLLGVGLVQSRVVYDQDALAQADLRARFRPQRRGVRLHAMQQTRESVMGWRPLIVALYFRRFGRTDGARRSNHEVDVVVVRTLGRVHALFLLHFLQLRNFYI